MIANNRERKPKNLFSDLGEGDPVRVIEVEDEHAEARYVAAEIAALGDEGVAGSEIAVFYRTNAQSRVLEDVLVRQEIPYQVIGGPRFYERAEIKDAVAYLQVIDNPFDGVSLGRIANRPRRGIGDASIARIQAFADAQGISLFEAFGQADDAGVGAAPLKAVRRFHTLMQSLMAGALEQQVPELLEKVLERTGYVEALEAERTVEAQGRQENLMELVGVAREYQEASAEPTLSEFLQQISLFSDQDELAEERSLVTLMTLHNAKGLEYRASSSSGWRTVSSRTRARWRSKARGGAAARLRRPDARAGAPDARPRGDPLALGLARLPAAERSSRSSRRTRSSASGCGRPPGAATGAEAVARADRACARPFHRRQRAPLDAWRGGRRAHRRRRHGDGALRPGRAERRLMLDYAPLEKVF